MTRQQARIFRTLKPFLLLAKYLGIFGCSVGIDGVKKSSIMWKIYCVSWLIAIFFFEGYADTGSLNPVVIVKEELEIKSMRGFERYAFLAGEILVSIFQQQKIVDFFDKMDDFDKRVINLGFSRQDETWLYWILSVYAFLAAVGDSLWRHFEKQTETFTFEIMFDYYYHCVQYLIVMKFCMFVHLIYQRFFFLNNFVTKSIERGTLMYAQRSVTIYELRYLHTKLCKAGESLEKVYGIWMLVWCGVVARTITRITQLFVSTGEIPNHVYVVPVWLFSLCWTCGVTSDEATGMSGKLLEVKPSSGDAADTLDRTEMAMYLMNHDLRFSAIGVFEINRPFLPVLAGILLTYVVFALG